MNSPGAIVPSVSKNAIARRFGRAASGYDRHAVLQLHAADALSARLPRAGFSPRRVLEIGCGTGFLSVRLRARFPNAFLAITDLSPEMVARTRARLGRDEHSLFAAMDGEEPAVAGDFDLIVAGLAVQWFAKPRRSLAALARLLRPGGIFAFSTLGPETFGEWRATLAAAGLPDGTMTFPLLDTIRPDRFAGGSSAIDTESVLRRHDNVREFLRTLRGVGATVPRSGHRPAPVAGLRALMRSFGAAAPFAVTYQIHYVIHRAAGAWTPFEADEISVRA